MNSTTILSIYLALFFLSFLIDWFLNILNINSVLKNRGVVPKAFEESIEVETYKKSVDYSLRKSRFGLFTSLQSAAFILIVLITQAAGALDGWISSWGLPVYWQGLIFLSLAFMALGLAGLPSSLYSRFVIEEEFGFNSTTARTYLSDMAKQIVLSLILLMALQGGLYAALTWTGRWWWLAAWAFWMVFQLIMVAIYPTLIAPFFNKFEPLPEGPLRERLLSLAERCGFSHQGIFVMDGSRRSRHSNAYFTGFGPSRRIVLFDTLVQSLQEDELEAVLAHEIGHWKFGHIKKRLALSSITALGLFALLGIALNWQPIFLAFGIGQSSLYALLFICAFFTSPLGFLISPLVNLRSRRHEFQSDRFAVDEIGEPEAACRALLKLGRDNLSNLTPHRAYSFWHYSHPALSQRLAALNRQHST